MTRLNVLVAVSKLLSEREQAQMLEACVAASDDDDLLVDIARTADVNSPLFARLASHDSETVRTTALVRNNLPDDVLASFAEPQIGNMTDEAMAYLYHNAVDTRLLCILASKAVKPQEIAAVAACPHLPHELALELCVRLDTFTFDGAIGVPANWDVDKIFAKKASLAAAYMKIGRCCEMLSLALWSIDSQNESRNIKRADRFGREDILWLEAVGFLPCEEPVSDEDIVMCHMVAGERLKQCWNISTQAGVDEIEALVGRHADVVDWRAREELMLASGGQMKRQLEAGNTTIAQVEQVCEYYTLEELVEAVEYAQRENISWVRIAGGIVAHHKTQILTCAPALKQRVLGMLEEDSEGDSIAAVLLRDAPQAWANLTWTPERRDRVAHIAMKSLTAESRSMNWQPVLDELGARGVTLIGWEIAIGLLARTDLTGTFMETGRRMIRETLARPSGAALLATIATKFQGTLQELCDVCQAGLQGLGGTIGTGETI